MCIFVDAVVWTARTVKSAITYIRDNIMPECVCIIIASIALFLVYISFMISLAGGD